MSKNVGVKEKLRRFGINLNFGVTGYLKEGLIQGTVGIYNECGRLFYM